MGVSQPVVSRSLRGLEEGGLVTSGPHADDRRWRQVRLSRRGQAQASRAKREVWPVVEAAVADACAPLQGLLLEQLAMLEAALDRASLLQRTQAPLGDAPKASEGERP